METSSPRTVLFCLRSSSKPSRRGDLIRAALLQLNEDHRDVLLKKYVGGFSVVEIAGHTGRSAKAVESLLSRARERLRELLSPYFLHMNQGDRHEPADLKQRRE